MHEIKFGTDGWRAIIAKEFTVDNVMRVTEAAALWMLNKKYSKVIIAYDCRFGGKMFSETAATVFADHGIKVLLDPDFATTPMVSLGVVKLSADLGVVITASHNTPDYNGYKLKSNFGGPTLAPDVRAIESLIPDSVPQPNKHFEEFLRNGNIAFIKLEEIYLKQITDHFEIDSLRKFSGMLAYDSMYGSAQNIMKKLFPDAQHLHDDYNPSFKGQAPEPIAKNLQEIAALIKKDNSLKIGLAHDGDADRIGLFDEEGNYIDSHHIMLLLLYYLVEYKHASGKVVISFAASEKIIKLSKQYGLEYEVTKIGFKHIAAIMQKEEVLLGGEEAGGISAKGHIPERDGIWMGLLIIDLMVKSGKSIRELIDIVHNKVGEFAYERDDLHLDEVLKRKVILKCETGRMTQIANKPVVKAYNLDGYKFYFSDDEWLMIRPSGTEPVMRMYAQAKTKLAVRELLDDAQKSLLY